MSNLNAFAITLASSDSIEQALIGSLQQNDTTWQPTAGGYGTLAGGDTVGWPGPVAQAVVDPDYIYITPSAASGLRVGMATIKLKPISSYVPPLTNALLQYAQNSSRLKCTVLGDLVGASFPANTTLTVYYLRVLRRTLTASDVRAMAKAYQQPGTPSGAQFTTFSYDELAYIFNGSTLSVTTTLDMTGVSIRYKPIIKLTNWTSAATPSVSWGGVTLTAGVDYRAVYDSVNHVALIQLYYDIVPVGNTPAGGQKVNATLTITPPTVALSGTLTPTDTLATSGMTPPAATLLGTLSAVDTAAGMLFPPAVLGGTLAPTDTLAGTLAPPAATLLGTLAPTETLSTLGLIPPAAALLGTLAPSDTLAGTITPPAAALSGVVAAADALAGTLAPVNIALAGTLAPVDTLAGALTTAALLAGVLLPTDTLAGSLNVQGIALTGTLLPTETLGGTLVTPNAPLSGTLTPTDTLAGVISSAAVALTGVIPATDTLGGALTPPVAPLVGTLSAVDTAAATLTTPPATLTGVIAAVDTLAGTLSAPAAALSGTLTPTDTIVGALSGAGVALSGALAPTDTLAGTLTAPAVALSGALVAADTLAGALSALVPLAGTLTPTDTLGGMVGIPLMGALSASDTLGGTLAPPAATLAGVLAPTETLAGALSALIALSGALTPSDTLAGKLTAGKRLNNELMTTDNVLSALSVVLPQGTAQAVAGGSISINDDSEIIINTATWPCLLIMEGAQDTMRINARTWQKKLTIYVFYLREWGDSAATNDQIWADINADMERMIANLADNPTLTCVLPGAGAATRNCLEIVSAEPSPRTQKVIDDHTYREPIVQRMLTIKVNLPPYIGLS